MIFVFIILSSFFLYNLNQLSIKKRQLEGEVKEFRKIKRKLNKWRNSQDKIIEILDNGLLRLKQLRLKRKMNKIF